MQDDFQEEVLANTDNRTQLDIDKENLIKKINEILNDENSVEKENELINAVQKQRALLLDIATTTFLHKPNNPKLLDAINSVIAGIEKTIRDNRKEKLKDRELEDNKTNFGKFVNALNEISNGKVNIPTYENLPFILDPLKPVIDIDSNSSLEITEGELTQGREYVDPKEVNTEEDD